MSYRSLTTTPFRQRCLAARLSDLHKRWSILTARWSWKLKFAKEHVTTHLPNGLTALIFASLRIRRQCFNSTKSTRRPASFTLKFRIVFFSLQENIHIGRRSLRSIAKCPAKHVNMPSIRSSAAPDSLNLLRESPHSFRGRHYSCSGPAIWADGAPTSKACICEHEVLYPKQ